MRYAPLILVFEDDLIRLSASRWFWGEDEALGPQYLRCALHAFLRCLFFRSHKLADLSQGQMELKRVCLSTSSYLALMASAYKLRLDMITFVERLAMLVGDLIGHFASSRFTPSCGRFSEI